VEFFTKYIHFDYVVDLAAETRAGFSAEVYEQKCLKSAINSAETCA